MSSHLHELRTAGLVYNHHAGQHVEYEVAPDRVHYDRDLSNGHFRLTVRSRGGGVSVTIEVRGSG